MAAPKKKVSHERKKKRNQYKKLLANSSLKKCSMCSDYHKFHYMKHVNL